jgi:hypothetical protein
LTEVNEIDVWRTARIICDHHKDSARAFADKRAEELHQEGDHLGWTLWIRVSSAIEKLQNMTPPAKSN